MPTANESCCLRSFPAAATMEDALQALCEIKEQLGDVVVLVQPESRGVKPIKVRPDAWNTLQKLRDLLKDPYAGTLTFIPRFSKALLNVSADIVHEEVVRWGSPSTIVIMASKENVPPCSVYFTGRTDHRACTQHVLREVGALRKQKQEPQVFIRDFC